MAKTGKCGGEPGSFFLSWEIKVQTRNCQSVNRFSSRTLKKKNAKVKSRMHGELLCLWLSPGRHHRLWTHLNHARQSIAIKYSCPNMTQMEILQLYEAWGRISKDTKLSGGDISPGTLSALPLLSLLVFQIRQSQDETNYPVTCYCFLQPFSVREVYFFCLSLSNS